MAANGSRLEVIIDLVKELVESERPDIQEITKRKELIVKRYNDRYKWILKVYM